MLTANGIGVRYAVAVSTSPSWWSFGLFEELKGGFSCQEGALGRIE